MKKYSLKMTGLLSLCVVLVAVSACDHKGIKLSRAGELRGHDPSLISRSEEMSDASNQVGDSSVGDAVVFGKIGEWPSKESALKVSELNPQADLEGKTAGPGETVEGHSGPLINVDPNTLRGYNSPVEDPEFLYKNEQKSADVLYVGQKLFNAQITDIYYQFKQYRDKIIAVQGMFAHLKIGDKENVPTIYRRGPGCCGNDGWGGFLLNLDEVKVSDIGENDWVEVVGRPYLEPNGFYYNLYIKVESITKRESRGAEYVRQ